MELREQRGAEEAAPLPLPLPRNTPLPSKIDLINLGYAVDEQRS